MHLSRYEKKHSLLKDLSKFLKIMPHYAFFFNYVNHTLRAKLFDFAKSPDYSLLRFMLIIIIETSRFNTNQASQLKIIQDQASPGR